MRSGDQALCGHCGYQGYVYGTPFAGGQSSGISAPWCPHCQRNDSLFPLRQTPKPHRIRGDKWLALAIYTLSLGLVLYMTRPWLVFLALAPVIIYILFSRDP